MDCGSDIYGLHVTHLTPLSLDIAMTKIFKSIRFDVVFWKKPTGLLYSETQPLGMRGYPGDLAFSRKPSGKSNFGV
jgi:hypothetical protein